MTEAVNAADDDLYFAPELVADLARHGYGPKFLKAQFHEMAKRRQSPELYRSARTVKELAVLDAAMNYVLGTLWRGRKVMGNLAKHRTIGASERLIDVGCGFGGTLVEAHRAGLAPTGIELDAHRVKSGRALLEDNGVNADLLQLNVFSPEFDQLGKFDWVVSANVIEHVSDVRGFLERLVGALAPGGTLYLEIPNGKCIQIVAADPHYAMPLLTLLRHHDAKALFHSKRTVDQYGMRYDVGDYHDLAFFRKCAADARLTATVVPDAVSFLDATAAGTHLRRVLDALESLGTLYPQVDAHLREVLIETGWRYFVEASRALGERHAGGLSADDSMRYFAPALHLYGDKPA